MRLYRVDGLKIIRVRETPRDEYSIVAMCDVEAYLTFGVTRAQLRNFMQVIKVRGFDSSDWNYWRIKVPVRA
jgi:hypothetical protein